MRVGRHDHDPAARPRRAEYEAGERPTSAGPVRPAATGMVSVTVTYQEVVGTQCTLAPFVSFVLARTRNDG